MIFQTTSMVHAAVELEIVNSDPFFNQVSKGKEQFTLQEVEEEIRNSANIGAERYLIQDGGRYVGVIEYLMHNPGDGHTWLGLLQINKADQARGYGARAMQRFYEIMKERKIATFRIGVVADNAPAHAFWNRQGFQRLEGNKQIDGKLVVVYEKIIE